MAVSSAAPTGDRHLPTPQINDAQPAHPEGFSLFIDTGLIFIAKVTNGGEHRIGRLI